MSLAEKTSTMVAFMKYYVTPPHIAQISSFTLKRFDKMMYHKNVDMADFEEALADL